MLVFARADAAWRKEERRTDGCAGASAGRALGASGDPIAEVTSAREVATNFEFAMRSNQGPFASCTFFYLTLQ